jgi:hypothetical protein
MIESEHFDPLDESEFKRHRKVAENHLATIVAKKPELANYSGPRNSGPELNAEDIRVLAVTIEMEDHPDPKLGRVITGVSRTAIRMVCGYDRNQQAKYRLDKLADNELVEMKKADDLPVSSPDPAPGYAIATQTGRDVIIDGLELLPILRRDRNTEAALVEVNSLLEDVHRELVLTTGRIMKLADVVSTESGVDIDFSDETELREYAAQTLENWEDNPDIFKPETLFDRLLVEEDDRIRSLLINLMSSKPKNERYTDEI